jgi:hypothetical protein
VGREFRVTPSGVIRLQRLITPEGVTLNLQRFPSHKLEPQTSLPGTDFLKSNIFTRISAPCSGQLSWRGVPEYNWQAGLRLPEPAIFL